MTEQAREKPPRRARGEGTVYWDKQRERFVATRIVGYDDRGKEIRKRGSGKSRSAAMEALRLRVRDYERGLAPGADKTTVSDIIKDWILYGQGQVDDKTVRTREFNCAHIDAGIGDVLLRKLTAKHVEKLLASMVATHSTRTIADVRACLNSAVKRAMARDLVDRNVVELVVTPRGNTGRKSKSLTERQALDILTLTKAHWMYAYIVVSMLVGIRTEEMRALTWDRVDLDADPATVAVWRSVRKSGDTKTRKSRRTLAIPDLAADVLRRRRRDQAADRIKPRPTGRTRASCSRRRSARRSTPRTCGAGSARPRCGAERRPVRVDSARAAALVRVADVGGRCGGGRDRSRRRALRYVDDGAHLPSRAAPGDPDRGGDVHEPLRGRRRRRARLAHGTAVQAARRGGERRSCVSPRISPPRGGFRASPGKAKGLIAQRFRWSEGLSAGRGGDRI